ncbi:extracellular solute-binding protein [Paenibacillus sp. HN-1]|uniref:extracellular solute-binding protein n=1 Tax=Paenibacillus TaxID=44249 RepID=UPI001CA8DE04|nr:MULTISPECIES: extracellular solute-binding protein [Paenibacillus]MBY9080304.1 extracellular solute-binding protein [Paenibacillus sp. CGMCC 1.18879]MBY9083037.1 extracellular solute-binding protein [Paenibacillus sinensis]
MKKWFVSAGVVGLMLLQTGCGGEASKGTTNQSGGGDVALKVWVDEESVSQTKEMVEAFKKEHSDKQYKIEVLVSDSMLAQVNVKNDPEAAADVFMLPHDQLGQLVESGSIYKNTKYADEIKESMTPASIEGASFKGELYAYPYGVETGVLYYNKSMLGEEDIKTFEGLTKKAKVGMNLAESIADYQIAPFFVANGSLLYGESGEDPNGTTFNDKHGLEVLKWIRNLKANPNVVHAKDDMVSSMLDGKIAAAIGGPWNKKDLAKLGDNLGVAPYPTADFGSGSKQMYAFQGVKLFAVKAATKAPIDAMALADYLVSEENQLKRFELTGIIPSNKKAQEAEEVKNDAVGKAVAIMSQDDHSVVMPKIPEVASFWAQCSPLINDAYTGKIQDSDMQQKLDQFVADIAK